MSSPPRQQRSKRSNSVYAFSANTILNTLKAKIKHIDEKSSGNKLGAGCTVLNEEIYIKHKTRKYRRVVLTDNNYKVGWVVDSDFSFCMICSSGFGWLTLKHHCRACGLLVCSTCTPYTTIVNNLFEEGGSRVCVNCFGLRIQEPSSPTGNSSHNSRYDHLEEANRPSIGNRMVVSRTELSLDTMDVDMDVNEKERAMIPLYEEAYNTMRQFIPLDIFRISFEQLLDYGLPEAIADRIWNNKILWLIVMHPDDIAKLHLAELRTKYLAENLDIIELRAVWYNVPGWDIDDSDGSSKVLQAGKNKWRAGLKARLNQLTELEERGQLLYSQMRNDVYEGFDDKYLFDPEISLMVESELAYRDGYGNPLGGSSGGHYSTPHHHHGGGAYGSAPAGSVLTSLLTPAENLYGSRYSNTSTTQDVISDALRSGAAAAPPATMGKLPRQGTVQRSSITTNGQNGVGGGSGRQQILLSDEDDTVYPTMMMSASLPNHMNGTNSNNNSNFNSPNNNNNYSTRYDLNQSMNSGDGFNGLNDSYYIGAGGSSAGVEREVRISSDFYVGSQEDGQASALVFDSPTPAAFNEAEMHQQYASKVLNANTNRVLSQYYQQQYEEQQLKLKLQQEQKEKLEKESQEKAALSAAKKKHNHTNTGSRSRSSSNTPKK